MCVFCKGSLFSHCMFTPTPKLPMLEKDMKQGSLTSSQYMIILFLLFLLQFALACACLAVNYEQKDKLAEQGWRMASDNTRNDVQRQFDCCGFSDSHFAANESLGHPACNKVDSLFRTNTRQILHRHRNCLVFGGFQALLHWL